MYAIDTADINLHRITGIFIIILFVILYISNKLCFTQIRFNFNVITLIIFISIGVLYGLLDTGKTIINKTKGVRTYVQGNIEIQSDKDFFYLNTCMNSIIIIILVILLNLHANYLYKKHTKHFSSDLADKKLKLIRRISFAVLIYIIVKIISSVIQSAVVYKINSLCLILLIYIIMYSLKFKKITKRILRSIKKKQLKK